MTPGLVAWWLFVVIELVVIGAVTYWVVSRMLRLLDRIEPVAAALERLLPAVPSKSAPRTEGPAEPEPMGKFLGIVQMVKDDVRPPNTQPMRRPVPGRRTDTSPEIEAIKAGTDAAEDHAQYGRHAVKGTP